MGSNGAGLTTALSTLVTALQTNQSKLSYISDNISNINTIGYTRRIVSQETSVSAGVGVGVNITEVRRAVDDFLLKTVRTQLSKSAQSDTTNAYMDRLQNFTFGNPGSAYTLNNSLNQFYTRLESFSGEPSSAVKRTLALNSSRDFTNTVSELASSIENERYNADQEISSTISTMNSLIGNIRDINTAIRQSSSVGGDLNSLYDSRDNQLNKLKEIMDVNIEFDSLGQATVSTQNTVLIGTTTKYKVTYDRASSVDIFKTGGILGGINVVSLDSDGNQTNETQPLLSASNSTSPIDAVPTGKLRALIDLRDTKLPAMLAQLDTFAYTFANEFNAIHNSGSGYPPAQSLTGTTAQSLSEIHNFSGQTRIALVDTQGKPVLGRNGINMPPLVIDFDKLTGDSGTGTASLNNILNEINSYYGTQPADTANIGAATDIRLGAVSNSISTVSASGTITFTGQPSNTETMVINGTTITFTTGTPTGNQIKIGASYSETLSNIENFLNSSNDTNISEASYTMAAGVLTATAKTAGTTGNSFTLNTAGLVANPATASGATLSGGTNATGNFTFDFDFSNLSTDGTAISFDVTQISVNGGATSAVTFDPFTQNAGDRTRTSQSSNTNKTITTSLTGLGLEEGDTFTVTATINVVDSDGITKTENVTFTVTVPDSNESILNYRYPATAVSGTGDGTLVASSDTGGFLTASLVDADGLTITDANTPGYLKIETTSGLTE